MLVATSAVEKRALVMQSPLHCLITICSGMGIVAILRALKASVSSILLGVIVCLENMAAFLFFLALLVVFMVPMIFISAAFSCFKQGPEPDIEAMHDGADQSRSEPKSVLTPQFIEEMFPRILFKDTGPIAARKSEIGPTMEPMHVTTESVDSTTVRPNKTPIVDQTGPESLNEKEALKESEDLNQIDQTNEKLSHLGVPAPPVAARARQSADDHLCSICLCATDRDAIVRQLPCSHIYHVQCIDRWFTKHSRVCPMCRETYGKEEPEETVPEDTYPLQYSDNVMDRFLLVPTIKYVFDHPLFFLGVRAHQRNY